MFPLPALTTLTLEFKRELEVGVGKHHFLEVVSKGTNERSQVSLIFGHFYGPLEGASENA